MFSPRLSRLSALLGIVGGLLLGVPALIEIFTGETASTSFALAISPALLTPLLPALYLHQSRAMGRFGENAYLINVVGLGLFGGAGFALNMVVFYLDEAVIDELLEGPTKLALFGSALIFSVGTVLFGIAMIRAQVLPRIPVWAYTTALPAIALLAPLPDTAFISLLHGVAGGALTWLSVALWRTACPPLNTESDSRLEARR